MNYKLTGLTPMLETQDMEATIYFYTEVLGFNLRSYNAKWGWASFNFDEVNMMFTIPNEHRNMPKPIMSGSLYFNPDDVDKVWEHVKEHCLICYPIENFDYGMREFGIYDNNGYLLQFGQIVADD
ncbi:putative enzyme related to lactoylglutathione lyase [Mucilaginibacter gracilis]|uniref:Putative enzyme related to lactoylglutathione lyase n=1 Tax=Mucilaginibacter gracilis TaxID=423350 RepID=A0A495J3B7_9SPHI|nr:VOC family protein [Mucilaginibacter gracilis]RKR83476.1 putative enzyme related to lactoylglutathione lyase [Mucilaginibacter gracilis]